MKINNLPKNLPDKPGVYFFLDRKNKPMYIGKATSLRDRVRSYFSKDLIGARGPLILDMVFKAKSLKWQETDSVLEALILEANLIKKYQPKYNTKEKDQKSFNYVGITRPARTARGGDEYPKVIIIRGKDLAQKLSLGLDLGTKRGPTFSRVFGPYTSSSSLIEALKIIRKIFPFLDEKSKVKGRYEFYRQLGLAPSLADRSEYMRNIRNIKLFLSGKKDKVLKSLARDMKLLAKEHRFEEAGRIRNQIFALKHIKDVSLIKADYMRQDFSGRQDEASAGGRKLPLHSVRIEAYDIAHMSGKNMVGVMTVVEDGEAKKSEYRKFKIRGFTSANDTGALLEVLERRFSHPEWPMPKLIVVDGGKAQINTALKFQARAGLAIPVVSVVKDERHRPKGILGNKTMSQKYEKNILLANSEAHRFAIAYFRNKGLTLQ